MTVKCTCADWEPGISKINGYIDVGRIHSMGDYTGKPFKYCPWCGKHLRREVIKIPAKPVNMGKAVRDIREAKIKDIIICDFCHNKVERKSVSSQFMTRGDNCKTVFAGHACPACVEKQAAFWKKRSRKGHK